MFLGGMFLGPTQATPFDTPRTRFAPDNLARRLGDWFDATAERATSSEKSRHQMP